MTGLRGKERRGRMLWIWQGGEKVHLSSFLPPLQERWDGQRCIVASCFQLHLNFGCKNSWRQMKIRKSAGLVWPEYMMVACSLTQVCTQDAIRAPRQCKCSELQPGFTATQGNRCIFFHLSSLLHSFFFLLAKKSNIYFLPPCFLIIWFPPVKLGLQFNLSARRNGTENWFQNPTLQTLNKFLFFYIRNFLWILIEGWLRRCSNLHNEEKV